jgi:hypothetical protein
MRRMATGTRGVSVSIGMGFGLVSGAIGVEQWALTAHEATTRVAAFQAFVQRDHPELVDWTGVSQGSQSYWLGTAAVAGVVMLIMYAVAGAVTARVAASRREGMVAAGVAVGIGSAVYVAASLVTYVLLPGSSITASIIAGILVFEPILGIIFVGMAVSLARKAVDAGERAGRRTALGHRSS